MSFAALRSAMKIAVVFDHGGLGDVGKQAVLHACRHRSQAGKLEVRAVGPSRDELKVCEALTPVDVDGFDNLDVREINAATDQAGLEAAFEGVSCVVSCWGNRQPTSAEHLRHSAAGYKNIVKAMEAKQVKRLVMLSSVGMGEDWGPMPWAFAGTIFKFMFWTWLRDTRKDLNAAEQMVQASALSYLIVRPTGLTPNAPVKSLWKTVERVGGKYKEIVSTEIAKEDVAEFMLKEGITPSMNNKAVTIGHPDFVPFRQLIKDMNARDKEAKASEEGATKGDQNRT